MDVLDSCWWGLDVHAKTVVACLVKKGKNTIRTCSTMTDAWLRLSDGLVAEGGTPVAIESPGVSWRPVFHSLEGVVDVMLVKARHVQAVPWRKTDMRDGEWVAD